MNCKDCNRELTGALDCRRERCARCYRDELRQARLFGEPAREEIEGKQRLLMEEAGTMFLR